MGTIETMKGESIRFKPALRLARKALEGSLGGSNIDTSTSQRRIAASLDMATTLARWFGRGKAWAEMEPAGIAARSMLEGYSAVSPGHSNRLVVEQLHVVYEQGDGGLADRAASPQALSVLHFVAGVQLAMRGQVAHDVCKEFSTLEGMPDNICHPTQPFVEEPALDQLP